jgi:hypothetical protein
MRAFFIAAILAVSAVAAVPASAQSIEGFEIGAHVTTLRLSGIDATDVGFGARLGWNLSNRVALEAEGDFFPTGRNNVMRGGRKILLLFGPKVGWRGRRVGAFAKIRSGIARVGKGRQVNVCVAIFPQPEGCYGGETRLAFDLGGAIEMYISPRSILRVDVSDLLTRLGPTSSRFGRNGDVAHDLLVGAGVGFRF